MGNAFMSTDHASATLIGSTRSSCRCPPFSRHHEAKRKKTMFEYHYRVVQLFADEKALLTGDRQSMGTLLTGLPYMPNEKRSLKCITVARIDSLFYDFAWFFRLFLLEGVFDRPFAATGATWWADASSSNGWRGTRHNTLLERRSIKYLSFMFVGF